MNRAFASLLIVTLAACGGSDAPQPENAEQSEAGAPAEAERVRGDADLSFEIPQCKHAPQASIYNRMGEMWMVEQSGDESLNLTVWHLQSGSDEFSFASSANGEQRRIDTVEGSTKTGSGNVTITRNGESVRFVIDGKDQSGNPVPPGVYVCVLYSENVAVKSVKVIKAQT